MRRIALLALFAALIVSGCAFRDTYSIVQRPLTYPPVDHDIDRPVIYIISIPGDYRDHLMTLETPSGKPANLRLGSAIFFMFQRSFKTFFAVAVRSSFADYFGFLDLDRVKVDTRYDFDKPSGIMRADITLSYLMPIIDKERRPMDAIDFRVERSLEFQYVDDASATRAVVLALEDMVEELERKVPDILRASKPSVPYRTDKQW